MCFLVKCYLIWLLYILLLFARVEGIYVFMFMQDQLNLRQVAQLLKRSTKSVRNYIKANKLKASKVESVNGLAEAVRETVQKISVETSLRRVILSGGVWQNITLLRRTLSLLRNDGFEVYIHREVPTNDGGLSLGQAVIAASRLRG